MSKKKYLAIAVVLVVIFLMTWIVIRERVEESPRDYKEIIDEGVLHIVTDYNSVGYFVSGDTIAGFNYELIKLMESYIPLKIEVLLESSLEKSIEGIQKGEFDVLAQNVPVTSELREFLRFTEPITQNKQVLVQRKKDYNEGVEPLRSHLDLAKKTLYVPMNSPAILRIRNLSHEIGDTIFVKEDEVYGVEQLVMMVASGEIDYAVCDEKAAAAIAESQPEVDYSTLIGFTHLEAWAVSDQSPVLLDSLNTWINRAKQTREYNVIYRKYYK